MWIFKMHNISSASEHHCSLCFDCISSKILLKKEILVTVLAAWAGQEM